EGFFDITYTFTDTNGCTSFETQSVTVFPLPVVGFTGLALEYCIDEPTVQLTGSPIGGTFSGSGINGNYFDPSAGEGFFDITYTFTDTNGCTSFETQSVTVFPLPVVGFTGLALEYCINEPTVQLTGSPLGGIFSGSGISGNTFEPSAGDGFFDITYTYTDTNGCINSETQSVTVFPLPLVSFTGLAAEYCIDEPTVQLTGLPVGGTFSGSGINGNDFEPSGLDGFFDITYTFTDTNSCTNSETQSVTVFPLPVIYLGMDTTLYITETLILEADSGFVSYLWNNGTTTQSLVFDASIYGVGTHTISVLVENQNQCFNSDTINITVIDSFSSQDINLMNSWSLISTFIVPTSPNVSDVFSVILSELIIVKDEAGAVYWPLFSINAIGDMIIGEAYMVKVENQIVLTIYGTIVNPQNHPIYLHAAWNLVGYLRQSSASIENLLLEIENNIIIVKNGLGDVYWPIFGINAIGDMQPGSGYNIKMSNADTLVYPANTINLAKSKALIPQTQHFNRILNTGSNMTLGIPATAWETEPPIGSEIGIFSESGKLVGSSVFTAKNLAISIWGDDEYSQEIDGMIGEESYIIQIWNGNSVDVVKVESWLEGDEFYETNKIAVAEKILNIEQGISNFELFQNNPNPFSQTTEIGFYIPEKAFVEIELFNLIGEKIKTIHSQNLSSGNHTIVFERKHLPSGVYFYRLNSEGFSDTKMMSVE
ncbi:MAG: T9SS type A sorting domain-containing protein, partial [Bacteroidetes bacterium]|nr:T9SS type A sorting domain-containing protein [Bacteroidota bacterium]